MNVRWSRFANDQASIVQAADDGFDCVELSLVQVMETSNEQFLLQKDLFTNHRIIPEVCSTLLPADVIVTDQGFNLFSWIEYLKKAIRQLSEAGCRKLVWNNGRARVLPLEGNKAERREQVLQFMHMLCDVAALYEVEILIEPLSPRRTNYLNSMEDIGEFIPMVTKDNIHSAISFRELSEIKFDAEAVSRFSTLINHVYLDNPAFFETERVAPQADDGQDYASFLSALKSAGYDGVITLPGDADASVLQYCKKIWSE